MSEVTLSTGLDRRDLADIHQSLVEESNKLLKSFHQYIRGGCMNQEYALRVNVVDGPWCIGMISVYRGDDYLYVGTIWIHPKFRGQGLGRYLFKNAVLLCAKRPREVHVESHIEQLGFKTVQVNAYSPEEVALWEKHGFQKGDFIEDKRSWTRMLLPIDELVKK